MPNKFKFTPHKKTAEQISSSTTDQWTANNAIWRYKTTSWPFHLNCFLPCCFIHRLKCKINIKWLKVWTLSWKAADHISVGLPRARQSAQNKPLDWDFGILKKTCRFHVSLSDKLWWSRTLLLAILSISSRARHCHEGKENNSTSRSFCLLVSSVTA